MYEKCSNLKIKNCNLKWGKFLLLKLTNIKMYSMLLRMGAGIDFLWFLKSIPNYPLKFWGAQVPLPTLLMSLVQNVRTWFGDIYLKLKNIYIVWLNNLLLIIFSYQNHWRCFQICTNKHLEQNFVNLGK